MPHYAVEMHGITKIYPENQLKANDSVDFQLEPGEILCLAGENGAGKTTLMKVLYGLEQPDEGTVSVMGERVSIHSPLDANRLGIGMVHQHFMLVSEFTVAQNVTLGVEPRRARVFYDIEKAEAEVADIIRAHRFSIDPSALVSSLTVGQRQQVEIVKMLYRKVRILILDEPTAVLTEQETESLFDTLRTLSGAGSSLILITHKLNEIKRISQRVSVMRQGRMIGTYQTAQIDELEISRLMMGHGFSLSVEKPPAQGNYHPVISFNQVTVHKRSQQRPLLDKLSFEARSGEILGFAGVGGNGLGVLEAVLGGFLEPSSGTIFHNGRNITSHGCARLRADALSYVPADRLAVGSALQATVMENVIVGSRSTYYPHGVLDRKLATKQVQQQLEEFSVKGSPQMRMGTLSGGNIQKVILAREIGVHRDYCVFSEPTWGLDIASSKYVYERMLALRFEGSAVVLISSNLDEVLSLSDRVVVLHRGRAVALLEGDALAQVTKEEMGAYMLGLRNQQSGGQQHG